LLKPTATPSTSDPIISFRDTATWLGVHLMTIRRLVDARKLQAVRVSERRVGIRRSVIEAYLKKRETPAADAA
jgi:excisionase family DNA binding protein